MTHTLQRPATRCGTTSRRAALTAAAAFALTLSPFPTRATTAATAQPTSHSADLAALSTFTLVGAGMEIRYEITPATGAATLSLHGDFGDMEFDEGQIDIENSLHLGNLITVPIEIVYDAWTLELTFLLPNINAKPGTNNTSFTSVAILTKHFSNIGGPSKVEGPLQTYQAILLAGTLHTVDA